MAHIGKPGLVVAAYAKARLEKDARDAVEGHFLGAWEALGITRLPDDLCAKVDFDWPQRGGEQPGLELLAARRGHADATRFDEAMVFRAHDLIVFATLLSTNASELTWSDLSESWSEAVGGHPLPDAAFGATRIYAGLFEGERPAENAPRALPAGDRSDGPMLAQTMFRSAEDLFVWEHPDRPDARASTLVVLAPLARQDALEHWTWRDPRLGPRGLHYGLLHLLAHVCKVRDQRLVYAERAAALSEQAEDTELALNRFLHGLEEASEGESSAEELRRLQDKLLRHQAQTGGLLSRMSELRELRQTLLIAAENLQVLAPRPHPGSSFPLFAVDLTAAQELPRQIEYDLGYAQAVQDRALEAHRLSSLRIEQGLESQVRTQARLTLFQATLVGALLAALGAIGAFKATVSLRDGLRWPFVLLLAVLVFTLPHLIINWSERYRKLDYALAGLLGISVFLLVDRLAKLPWAIGAPALLFGGLALPGVMWVLEKVVGGRERKPLRQNPEWGWVRTLRVLMSPRDGRP